MGKPGLTMALSPCVVPLGLLRVGALRPATLAASVYPVVCLILLVVEEASALCEGAPAPAVTVYVSFCLNTV